MHSIERQIIEITTGSEAQAHEIGTRLQAAWEAGAPELDRVFDRISDGGAVRIDRLELDLGTLAGADWVDLFFRRLATAFERSSGHSGANGGKLSTREDVTVIAAEGFTRATLAGTEFDALLLFLRRGRLPWWSDVETGRGWLARAVTGLAPEARQGLRRIAAAEATVLARLVRALPAKTLAGLLAEPMPPQLARSFGRFVEALAGAVETPAARWRLREAVWQATLREAEATQSNESAARLARAWLGALEATDPGGSAVRAVSDDPALAAHLPEPWRDAFRAALTAHARASGRVSRRRPNAPGSDSALEGEPPRRGRGSSDRANSASVAAPGSEAMDAGKARKTPTVARGAPPALEPEETVPVTGAGVVLLHPFLPELFTRAGFWSEGAFVSPEARHLAVRLLGYLTFGDAEAEEADLVLARTICALGWEEPLLPEPPEAEALAAADALLASVLEHWTVLRSSSVDWLREQFFRRDGYLKPNDDGWTLKVETRAQDVLLGRLPWGYGVVMLPWLAAPITVQWRD